ncbi:MAG: D-fructose-6-phosphate amidotransferase [Chloroflexi bacterium]|nr:D-fructose-6-phosphate amidotransferase [Chloroflexota bacterium]
MAAYFIAEVDVTDPAGFEEYRKLVGPLVDKYGGRYVVRGGASEASEGDWSPGRIVIIEFESMERLKAWHDSDEYRPVMAMRHNSATTKAIMVEGA